HTRSDRDWSSDVCSSDLTQHDGMKVLRVGYDLFGEVRFLLSTGQPPSNALIPTLDIHISMLRTWILEAGIPVVEIPPVPAGFERSEERRVGKECRSRWMA